MSVMTALQGSLFELDASPGLGPLADLVVRHDLGRGAWVDLLPGWLGCADEVYDRLLDLEWRAERRQMYERVVDVPRLLRFYGEDETLPHPMLTGARRALNEHYGPMLGEPFTTAGMCLYRDGNDSVAWHGDTLGRGPQRRHHGRHRLARFGPRVPAATAWRRHDHPAPARPRRPDRDGRILPEDLGACGAQDVPVGRTADECAVPAAWGALSRQIQR